MPVLSPRFQPAKCILLTLALFASIMWMLSDMLWSMYGPRSAAISRTRRCLISQVVLYRSLMFSGMISISWMDPLWRRI